MRHCNLSLASMLVVTAACGAGCAPGGTPDANRAQTKAAAAQPSIATRGEASTESWDDFPDPMILPWNNGFYAYATGPGIRRRFASDLGTGWYDGGSALAQTPGWGDGARTWAPFVLPIAGQFVMFYSIGLTGWVNPNGQPVMCLSRAVATDPWGPFYDASTGPIMCQTDLGGSIDGSAYYDENGAPWLVWKSEGNAIGQDSHLFSAQLAGDGSSLVGGANWLDYSGNAWWKQGVIEGPAFTRQNGQLYLFYSGNLWDTQYYSMGFATCDHPWGPCTEQSANNAWAYSSPSANAWGPGGGEFFTDKSGQLQMAYHAWYSQAANGARTLRVDAVTFPGGWPSLLMN